ncbi:MAG: PEP-CTERM sorting domain-containing protein [Planctomycetota bacterium]
MKSTAVPLGLFSLATLTIGSTVAAQPLLISEILTDPPGFDAFLEYIEITGAPGQTLDDIFLIQIENENDSTGSGTQGSIDLGFDLTGTQLGSNGALVLAAGNTSSPAHVFDPAATLIQGTTSGGGFGGIPGFFGGGVFNATENSGGTFAIVDINAGPAPTVNQDLDIDDDGTLDLPAEWEIIDSIGFTGENENEFGGLYGAINFLAGTSDSGELVTIPPGPEFDVDPATVILTGFEIEYVGRLGDGGDFFAANVTDDPNPSASNPNFTEESVDIPIVGAKFVISAADTALGDQTGGLEVTVDLPYGVSPFTPGNPINIGADLVALIGDFNGDGFVGFDDLNLVLLNFGDAVLPEGFDEAGLDPATSPGGVFDGILGQNELDDVLLNFGNGTVPGGSITAVPEPTTGLLLATGGLWVLRRRSKPSGAAE